MTTLLINTSLIAFISAVLGGIVPIRRQLSGHFRWMHQIDSFCDGMFIAIALTHLLPEIYEHTSTAGFISACMVILSTITLIQYSITRKASHFKHIITYLLFAHCFIEGMAVSMVSNQSLQATLSMTILAHKIVEAFVFFNLITRQKWSKLSLYILLIIFALLTPAGIVVGGYLSHLPHYIGIWVNTLTCGTFLGISINCFLINPCDEHSHHVKIWLVLGFIALAMLMPTAHAH